MVNELPACEDLVNLPRKALVSFAARCARLIQVLFEQEWPSAPAEELHAFNQAIHDAEQFAAGNQVELEELENGHYSSSTNAAWKAAYRAEEMMNDSFEHPYYETKAYSIGGVAHSAISAAASLKKEFAAYAAFDAASGVTRILPEKKSEVIEAYCLLCDACEYESWTDETSVQPQFFSSDSVIERRVMFAINDLCVRLCENIARNGTALEHIEWRTLEWLLAVALDGIGFKVTLTPSSKDGGKDIIAECTLVGKKTTYYLEIKHWRSSKKVAYSDVSSFVEVNVTDGTQGGLFLSSSGFSNSVFAQLSEITRHRIRIGGDTKIISLCQQFVQRRKHAAWQPKDVLPQILFEQTLECENNE